MTPERAREARMAIDLGSPGIRVEFAYGVRSGCAFHVTREDGRYMSRGIEGWPAGVVEPICSTESDYLERVYLAAADRVAPWTREVTS